MLLFYLQILLAFGQKIEYSMQGKKKYRKVKNTREELFDYG